MNATEVIKYVQNNNGLRINDSVYIEDAFRTDLHIHTIYCDGNNTPEQMVQGAIRKGLKNIGFSGHSYIDFDPDWTMSASKSKKYFDDINSLKEKYKNDIKIFCGIEQDALSPKASEKCEFIIGSVHHVPTPDGPMAIDYTPEILNNTVKKYFGNDYYALAQCYFDEVSNVVEDTNADIIGHFDLISKYNERLSLFDEKNQRYKNAWMSAADKLIEKGRIFEINFGAFNKGLRSVPYPAPEILDYLMYNGASFILSSDSHSDDTIGCWI